MEELKIIEPVKTGLNHFKTTDEFSIYYNKHKNELNEMTTQKLNKQFKIDGYRITKIGTRDDNGKRQCGNICLKKINDVKLSEHASAHEKINNDRIEQLETAVNQRFVEIENKLQELAKTINSIITALNEE